MEKSLYNIVKGCKQNDEECFQEIFNRFLPMIRKYCYRFKDREEAYDTLSYYFILCLYRMPLENNRFENDGVIVSYISATIRNQYYAMCKEESKYTNTTCSYDELLSDSVYLEEDNLLLLSLEKYFNASDIELIKQKILYGYTDTEIARTHGISRQAVNKKVHRVIKKLRKLYMEGLIF